jgi:hypothetical protein
MVYAAQRFLATDQTHLGLVSVVLALHFVGFGPVVPRETEHLALDHGGRRVVDLIQKFPRIPDLGICLPGFAQ